MPRVTKLENSHTVSCPPQRRLLSVQATPDVAGIRTATLMEQEYTVIPCVALVEGVLWPANAEAPELALAEEFGKFPAGWNGRPVVLNHPVIDDTPVSANTPSVLEDYAIGQMFNTRLDGNKLKTEIWINNARVAALGGEFAEVVERLKNGDEIVEVSTGLFTVNEQVSGVYNGEEYTAIWRNIVPDHLAVLSKGSVGACSVKDGCGAPRTNEGKLTMEPVMRAAVLNTNCRCQEISPTGAEGDEGKQEGLFKRLLNMAGNLLTFRDQSENLSDGDIRTALYAALAAEDPSSYCFVIAVFHGDDDSGRFVYEEGFTGMLFQRAFAINDDGSVTLGQERTPVRPVTQFIPVTVNSDGLPEDVSPTVPEEVDPSGGGDEITSNTNGRSTKQRQETVMTKKELVQSLIDNQGTKFTKDDAKWLEGLDEAQLQKLFPEPASASGGAGAPLNEPTAEGIDKVAVPSNNSAGARDSQPLSEDEYIARAPQGIREVLQEGLRMQRARRDALIKGLVANERCRFTQEELSTRSLTELENLAELARIDVTYEGAAAGGDSMRTNTDDDAPPPPPLVFGPKKDAA